MDKKESLQETIDHLTAELAAANKTIDDFKAARAQASADEKVVHEKMSFGLTRDQALSVIKRQRDHDAYEAAQAKAKQK